MTWKNLAAAATAVALAVPFAACDGDPATPDPGAALVAIVPVGGATGVDPAAPIVVTFDHAINPSMTAYAALHEGSVSGPAVDGTWSLSDDGLRLTFTQAAPLKPATTYVVHLGGGMRDAQGHHVDLGSHGGEMGGQWASGTMMSGGMMGGQPHGHMGTGWQHPANGSYGMIFTFTTAG